MIVGLRIDVDTLRGTERGVPALCAALRERGIAATFFFSVGPDNMGRHLWRLLRPAFLAKMVRSRAPALYGWDVLRRGTLWPGPPIGARLPGVIRAAADAGHEVGFHAWDHHRWQARIHRMSTQEIREATRRGVAQLAALTGAPPTSAAAPGWRSNDTALRAQSGFGFAYQSDCRGHCIFLPQLADDTVCPPQIPATLPTYDEVIGRDGWTDGNFGERMLARLDPRALNVLTVHAEVEGIARLDMFTRFLDAALAAGWAFTPLRDLLPASPAELPTAHVVSRWAPGREGWIAWQGPIRGTRWWRAHEATGDQPPFARGEAS